MVKRQVGRMTHHIYTLPVVVLELTGRCGCRCVMCDIWQAGSEAAELTVEQLRPHLAAIETMRVRHVVLSGGEPLLHHDPWGMCALLRSHAVNKITLLSAGLLLARHAADVLRWCDAAIVSLDGPRDVHDAIRNVPHAYDRLAKGVATLKSARPDFRVTARCVVQRRNYAELRRIVDAAHALGLDGISFLMADVSSTAFSLPAHHPGARASSVALTAADVAPFCRAIEDVVAHCAGDIESGFIAEPAHKLRGLARYARAGAGEGEFTPVRCNAPWVSTVIEPDGSVRPCFFHRPIGDISEQPLDEIINSDRAVAFRERLDVTQNAICQRCVCTLYLGLRGEA